MRFRERHIEEKIEFLRTITLETHKILTKSDDETVEKTKQKFSCLKNFLDGINKTDTIYEQNEDRGRYYAKTPSVQSLNKVYRSFLCRGITTDLDIKNCYPTILKYICDTNNILCPVLKYYVENREEVFRKYPCEKEEIKNAVFCIIFGQGNKIKNPFTESFRKEIKVIREQLKKLDTFKQYFDNFPEDKKNKEGSATFKIIEDIEIKIITKLIEILKKKNIEIFAYMYDGLMIYGEWYYNENLLPMINEEVNKEFQKINIEFVYKDFDIPDDLIQMHARFLEKKHIAEDDGYESVKKKFEMFCAKIIEGPVFIIEKFKNGKVYSISRTTENRLKSSYKHISFSVPGSDKKIPFVLTWLWDGSMRLYNDVGFYPPDVALPNGVYNLWTPFYSECIEEYEERNDELNAILKHIKIICGNDQNIYDYFINWIACLIKHPSKKLTCPVFVSEQGAGKGTMFNLFRRMLGENKVLETTNPARDVWGDFNGQMLDSYLVNLNELGKKQQQDNVGKIKGLITDKELTINQKGIDQMKTNSFHKFIITTNNEDPVYTNHGERRFFIIRSSDEKIKDVEYFQKLNKILCDDNVIKTCFEYFKNLDIPEGFFSMSPPNSEYHEKLKDLNRPPVWQFLEKIYFDNEKKIEITITNQELFDKFDTFLKDNKIKFEMTCRKFLHSLSNLGFKSITESKRTDKNRSKDIIIKQLGIDLKITKTQDYLKFEKVEKI